MMVTVLAGDTISMSREERTAKRAVTLPMLSAHRKITRLSGRNVRETARSNEGGNETQVRAN